MTFQEIMDFHTANPVVFKEIKENLDQLLPFVGAGLTADFYGVWSKVLKELGKNIMSSEKRDELVQLLQEYKFLDAAQFLEECRGGNNLSMDMVDYFSREKLVAKWNMVRRSALFLLPPLFPRPVLTTNFDEGIEMVYHHWRDSDFRVLNPYSEGLRNQAKMLNNTPCLFKLHGSIDGNMTDIETLVFTLDQYDRHYGRRGRTKSALKSFINSRSLLFLGCSLENDRTVDLLRTQAKSGAFHFAIVNCKPDERDARLRELDDLHIRAIVYPDGEYESVRIILEQLLKGKDPDAYNGLEHRVSELPLPVGNPYVYQARMTPLLGRDHEMDRLMKFVTDTAEPFCWWALTGPGGSGKSKLAMELMDRVRELHGWTCLVLDDFNDLPGFFARCRGNTLVVVDYVQAHARELGEQMQKLGKGRTHPLRLLLTEREDSDNTLNWMSQLYENVHDKTALRNLCWDDKFLTLSLLDDSVLGKIISAFAEKLQQTGMSSHPVPSEEACKNLLKLLLAIDPELHRPLYALFLTGAWMDGEDPTHWSQKDVLEYIINRECTLLDERLRQVTGVNRQKPAQYEACVSLYRLSTAMLGPNLKNVSPGYAKWRFIERAADDAGFAGPERLLKHIGLLKEGRLTVMEPDLMGEYFVYHWLTHEAEDECERQEFLRMAWQNPLPAFIFFCRLFSDYAYLLNDSTVHWQMMLPPLHTLMTEPNAVDAWLYARLAKNALAHCEQMSQSQRIADQLDQVHTCWPEDRNIALEWAMGLVNHTTAQDVAGASVAVDRLEALTKCWSEDRQIALLWANGLVNLSKKQYGPGASAAVDRLEALAKRWPKDREFALEWAAGLFNLSADQDEAGASAAVDRLETLAKRWPEDREFALSWANGLFNLSVDQDEVGGSATVDRLEALAKLWQEDQEFALVWAKGLVNLSYKQDEAGTTAAIAKLEALAKRWPEDREFALAWAKGLFALAYKQDETGTTATVDRMEALAKRWPEDREFALEWANGLINLSFKQDEVGATATVDNLEALAKRWPEDREFALAWAKGLVNLSNKQDEGGTSAAVVRLEALAKCWPENREITLEWAMGLVNLSNKQDEARASATVDRLEGLAKSWPDDREIVLQWAKGLVNLSIDQNEAGASATVDRLEALAKRWPEDREIALVWANGLFNLSIDQDEAGATATLDKLEVLVKRWLKDQEIALVWAKGLFILSIRQAPDVAIDTLARLSPLLMRFPEDSELKMVAFHGLQFLLERQNP